jgi:serine/threonine protein kinase
MESSGRRSEDRGEPSYDRDPLSHPYNQHQRRRQQFHNQGHYYNQPFPSSNGYPREQSQHGQLQSQQPPPALPYHQTGSATETNGNYNNNSSVPVPPRMRMRKWSDMTRTIWHYERIEQIGEGTYGQVYRARCKDTNEIVAMKKIRVHHGAHWGMPPTVIREIKILKRLVHPNLVRMIEVVSSKGVEHLDADDYHKGSDRSRKNKHKHKSEAGHGGADNNGKDNNNSTKNDNNINSKQSDISDAREGYKGNLFLVLEYVPHDLTGLLDVAYKFSEVEIKCVFRQLLGALRYMHDQKYVHRDIKSSNILIDRHFRLKLADFGLARSIEPPLLDNLHEYVLTTTSFIIQATLHTLSLHTKTRY